MQDYAFEYIGDNNTTFEKFYDLLLLLIGLGLQNNSNKNNFLICNNDYITYLFQVKELALYLNI